MPKQKLTQEMIDEGEKGSRTHCLIAKFIRHYNPGVSKVDVDVLDGRVPSVLVDGQEVVWGNPKKVLDIIVKFDNNKEVKPTFLEYEDF